MKQFLAKLGKFGILIVVLAILVLCFPQVAHFATDYLWRRKDGIFTAAPVCIPHIYFCQICYRVCGISARLPAVIPDPPLHNQI